MQELQKIMAQYNGQTERLPEGQVKIGREIDLNELVKVLDDWREAWDMLEPQTVDKRRHRERRYLEQNLSRYAKMLADMTFKITLKDGCCTKKQFTNCLLSENPEQKNLIKELFNPDSWWLLIARAKGRDGSDHLDFCHVNTRKVVRLNIGPNSPIIDSFSLDDPVEPKGNIAIF